MDDFEACIVRLRLPVGHCRAIRTTNLLERLFVEERRRPKITEFESRQMTALKKELDQQYEADIGLDDKNSKNETGQKIHSTPRT